MARLPEAVFKPVHHLTHMESQKRVELVEALVYWRLVDELMRCEGIDEGQFSVDYDVTFKPTVKLTQVMSLPVLPVFFSIILGQVGSSLERLALCVVRCPPISGKQSFTRQPALSPRRRNALSRTEGALAGFAGRLFLDSPWSFELLAEGASSH